MVKKGQIRSELDKLVSISCGGYASYALTEGGRVLSWGTEVCAEFSYIDRASVYV